MQKRILIVDDERPLLKFYERTFVKKGYLVSTAESAHEALEKLSTEKYLVMFFDLKMPEMNGIELCKEVLTLYPDSLIYAITGYPTQFEREGCLAIGFKGYFSKPVNMEELSEVVEETARRGVRKAGKPEVGKN